mgnify:CR=1 FL=1
MNKQLVEQKETVGMTASEVEIYRAKLNKASETQLGSLYILQESNDAMEEEIKLLEEEEAQIKKRDELYKNCL